MLAFTESLGQGHFLSDGCRVVSKFGQESSSQSLCRMGRYCTCLRAVAAEVMDHGSISEGGEKNKGRRAKMWGEGDGGGTKSKGWEERAHADAETSDSISIWNSKK